MMRKLMIFVLFILMITNVSAIESVEISHDDTYRIDEDISIIYNATNVDGFIGIRKDNEDFGCELNGSTNHVNSVCTFQVNDTGRFISFATDDSETYHYDEVTIRDARLPTLTIILLILSILMMIYAVKGNEAKDVAGIFSVILLIYVLISVNTTYYYVFQETGTIILWFVFLFLAFLVWKIFETYIPE